jgi:hypothetical protein
MSFSRLASGHPEERSMRTLSVLFLVLCSWSGVSRAEDFQPDPRSVLRHGAGYRYPQSGWIVLHIEGEAYERGVQHGRLLAPEIAGYVRCFAASQSAKAPSDGWKLTRLITNALFLRQFDREYLEEMKGIADGASAAGAKFDGRPIDLLDIVAINAWAEIDTLDNALDALPTGLEGVRFPKEMPRQVSPMKPMHCSAFAATGSATKDGKIVFGHITMFGIYPANFFNIWLDVKPAKGHRVFMQTFPGGIQSGMDYYYNDAGLLVCETTITQTRFEPKGMALASRIRKALQYGENFDQAVAYLKEGNNGLYTNEWLLGDTKTNEIAMFELGTHKSKLWRSSKNEWFGGTEGFYWGCNNTKDLDVRLETIASVEGRPAAAVFHPSDRDKAWLKLFDRHKGKIDADFGRLAFTTPPVAAYHSFDAKYTTTDLAKQLKTWALFGPPLGRTWEPTREEREMYPEVRSLVSNPWTVLHGGKPADSARASVEPVDIRGHLNPVPSEGTHVAETPIPTVPAWHGTILAKTDADVWLATGFANYERIVALEKALRKKTRSGSLTEANRDKVALALFPYRAEYELGSRAGGDTALSKIHSDVRRDDWYRIASGKGVLLLDALRQKIGADKFDDMMNRYGKENAGKPVTTAAFRAHVEKAAGMELDGFFDEWLDRTGLPSAVRDRSGPFSVTTFAAEREETLIVYGTTDETPTNREAARALQQAIRAFKANVTVPIKADRHVTVEELKTHHLLLIGRPDSNSIVQKFQGAVPVTFGSRSFTTGKSTSAHADSAVIAAAANPDNPRYSVVVIAGLEAYSTRMAAPRLTSLPPAEVVVLPHGESAKAMIVSTHTKPAGEKK